MKPLKNLDVTIFFVAVMFVAAGVMMKVTDVEPYFQAPLGFSKYLAERSQGPEKPI